MLKDAYKDNCISCAAVNFLFGSVGAFMGKVNQMTGLTLRFGKAFPLEIAQTVPNDEANGFHGKISQVR